MLKASPVVDYFKREIGKIMTINKPTLKTCKNGHKFYKSSDCPICPISEEERKPKDNLHFMLDTPMGIELIKHIIKIKTKL